jgi:nicotinamide phosphoribosyltransferase
MQRDGCVVIRPDSGNPSYVVRRLLNILGEKFGYTRTAKGFKVLNPKVRLIQGDGIDLKSMSGILEDMIVDGWSVDNIAFGSGGGLLQKVNRDTCRFAMKCSAIEINGKWHDVMKQPATDLSKKSKPGRLTLQRDSKGGFFTSTEDQEAALKGIIEASENQLVKVFQSGVHYEAPMLSAVRERAAL